jgi:hypothetical protein
MALFIGRGFIGRAPADAIELGPRTGPVVDDVPLPKPSQKATAKPKQPKHPMIEAEPGLPKPERKTLWLVSEGLKRPTWTIHFFVESRECDEGIEFVYQCSRTNVQRRFGLLPHPVVFTPRN